MDNEEILLPFPRFKIDERGEEELDNAEVDLLSVNQNEFFDLLIKISGFESEYSTIWDIYKQYYLGHWGGCPMVCLTSIIDPEFNEVMILEETCEKYHCLPEPGGLYDQPAQLMEAFYHIRVARAQYMEVLERKQQQDLKKVR